MLLDAIFSYGEDGIAPAFNNPALSIVWGFVQPLLDADEKRYKDRCKKARECRMRYMQPSTNYHSTSVTP